MKVRIEYLDGVTGLLICYMMLNHIILRANIGISVDNVWLEPLQFFMFWFFYKSGMFYKPKPIKQLLVSGGHKLLLPWLVFGVAGHLRIGSNVVIAARSGVTNDVPDGSMMSGYPLREHMEDLRIKMSMGKVPELIKKVKKIEKELSKNK